MIARWRRFVCFSLPVVLVSLISGAVFYADVQLDSSTSVMLSGDQRGQEMLMAVTNLLSAQTLIGVVVEREEWFDDQGAAMIAGMSYALGGIPGNTDVRSLTSTPFPTVNRFWMPSMRVFMPLRVADPSEWAQVKRFVTNFPLSRNLLVSEDGRYLILGAMYDRDLPTHADRKAFRAEVHEALEPFREHVLSMDAIGLELAQADIVDTFLADGLVYGIAFIGFTCLVILLTFRSPVILGLVLVYLGFGLAMLAVVFLINRVQPNLYTAILFPLVSGLQLTFLTHFFSALQRSFVESTSPDEAMARCLQEVLRPSAMAAVTTMIGLLSLLLCEVPIVRTIGILGAQAVLLMFVGTFLPACAQVWWSAHRSRLLQAETVVAVEPGRRRLVWPWVVLPLVLLLAAASIPGLYRIDTDIRAAEFLSEDSETLRAFRAIDQKLGGVYIFAADCTFDQPRGAQTPQGLAFLEKLRNEVRAIDGVGECYTYSQLYTTFNALQKKSDDYESFPGAFATTAISTMINSMNFMFKDELQNDDASVVSMFVRSSDMRSHDYLALIEEVLAKAEALAPPGVTVVPRNGLQTFLAGDRAIVRSLVSTMGLSVFLVLLTLMGLWFSWRLGLAGLLVVLPALLLIGAMMGYLGYPLNSITVMLSALILGIAVDDAIHVVSLFRSMPPELDRRAAASTAVRRKLKPMLCTSAILVCLFGLLTMSSFPPVANFGILAASALVVALLSAIFLLPILLAGFGTPRRAGSS